MRASLAALFAVASKQAAALKVDGHAVVSVIPGGEDAQYVELSYLIVPGSGLYEGFMQPAAPELEWLSGPKLLKKVAGRGSDYLQVWKRGCGKDGVAGYCSKCAVSFSGTDDAYDPKQTFNTTRPAFCGAEEGVLGGGFVEEVRGFFTTPGYETIRAALQKSACGQMYTVGHSLGGAVATTFAFCVNSEIDGGAAPKLAETKGFSAEEDKTSVQGIGKTRLITFGALAVATEPLWNGVKGNCFEGARFYVGQGSDYPTASVGYLLEWLEMVASVYSENGEGDRVPGLDLAGLYALKASFQWAELSARLRDTVDAEMDTFIAFWQGKRGGAGVQPKIESFIDTWGATVWPYSYDQVPAMLRPDLHPLIQNIPLKHPMSNSPSTVWNTPAGSFIVLALEGETDPKCNPEASSWPRMSPAQTYVGNKMYKRTGGTSIPNHMPCCYSRGFAGKLGEKCPQLYGPAGSFVECQQPGY